jgi:hypothetical protein
VEFILCNPLDTSRSDEHCRSDFLKNLLCGKENIEMFSEKSVSVSNTHRASLDITETHFKNTHSVHFNAASSQRPIFTKSIFTLIPDILSNVDRIMLRGLVAKYVYEILAQF